MVSIGSTTLESFLNSKQEKENTYWRNLLASSEEPRVNQMFLLYIGLFVMISSLSDKKKNLSI